MDLIVLLVNVGRGGGGISVVHFVLCSVCSYFTGVFTEIIKQDLIFNTTVV